MRQLGIGEPEGVHAGRRVFLTMLVLVFVGLAAGATVGWALTEAVGALLGLVDVQ
jgi:hypothetical protein